MSPAIPSPVSAGRAVPPRRSQNNLPPSASRSVPGPWPVSSRSSTTGCASTTSASRQARAQTATSSSPTSPSSASNSPNAACRSSVSIPRSANWSVRKLYVLLARIERSFRYLKSTLGQRSVFHQRSGRVDAYLRLVARLPPAARHRAASAGEWRPPLVADDPGPVGDPSDGDHRPSVHRWHGVAVAASVAAGVGAAEDLPGAPHTGHPPDLREEPIVVTNKMANTVQQLTSENAQLALVWPAGRAAEAWRRVNGWLTRSVSHTAVSTEELPSLCTEGSAGMRTGPSWPVEMPRRLVERYGMTPTPFPSCCGQGQLPWPIADPLLLRNFACEAPDR